MSGISDILRKVFGKEEASLISWLQRRKLFVFAIVVAGAVIWVYIKWHQVFNIVLTSINEWLIWLLFGWLLALTLYLYQRDKVANEKVFKDDFRHGLEKWEYYGDWRSESEGEGYILRNCPRITCPFCR